MVFAEEKEIVVGAQGTGGGMLEVQVKVEEVGRSLVNLRMLQNMKEYTMDNDMIQPAVHGVLNLLTACTRAKSIKRVVMNSSVAVISIMKHTGEDRVMSEEDSIDVQFLYPKLKSLLFLGTSTNGSIY
ncbi:Anthocyanidin reductase [Bienertia sinuspersici]